jgi:hypothetical protein
MMTQNSLIEEFWRCFGCNKSYRAAQLTYRLLKPYLPTGKRTVILLCEACNDLRSYGTNDLPVLHTFDVEAGGPSVLVEKVFTGRIACTQIDCASPIEIISPRTVHWDLKGREDLNPSYWTIRPSVVCAAGHAPAVPILWHNLEEEIQDIHSHSI